jgi:hypothetical protein
LPSSVIGSLRVSLGLDSSQFNQGATSAEKRAHALGDRIGKSMRSPIAAIGSLKGVIGTLAGALALQEFAVATQRAFDFADSIQDLSDRTGASTKLIQEFRYAAQLTGSDVGTADESLGKFTKTLGLAQQGSKQQADLFKSLGVTSSDFDEAFRQTLDGLAKLPTIQQRNAVALQIFGKGAATLTNLLGQGSAAFEQMAAKAQALGLVISGDLLANAGQVNDKLDTMKMILDTKFASAIVTNADALGTLADGFLKVATNALQAIEAARNFYNLQGFQKGDIGSGVALSKTKSGRVTMINELDGLLAQNSRDRASRRGNRRTALGGLIELTSASDKASDAASDAQFKKLNRLRNAVMTLDRASDRVGSTSGRVGGGRLPPAARSGGGKDTAAADAKRLAAERQRAAEKAAADEKRYQDELSRTQADELAARIDLTVDATKRAALESERLQLQSTNDIEQVKLDKDLTEAQKGALVAIIERTSALQQDLLDRRRDQEVAAQALESAQNRLANDQDILQAQLGLARTSKERGRIEKLILDKQFEALRLAQQVIIDNEGKQYSPKQIEDARDRLKNIGQVQGYANAKSARDNQGPLASYLDSIPKSADEVNEAIEGIEANGLSSLIDGLSKTKGRFKDLAATVSSVADDIIASLLKIGLQKGIAALFGSALGAATGSSAFSPGDFLNSSSGPLSGGFAGARAKGGPVSPGKMYLVGEKGPEPFIPSTSGTIIPNDALTGGKRGDNFYQTVNVTGGTDLVRRADIGPLASAVKAETMRAIADAQRRRGS